MNVDDPISIPPTIDGPHAKAWRMDYVSILKALGNPKETAGVCMWLVEAPWAHPFWHSYRISLVHLRPIEALGPATIYLEGATHEMVVEALDPEKPRQAALDRLDFAQLQPANFAAQMIKSSDADAEIAVGMAVKMICDGRLNPDTDFRAQWIAMFGDNMMKDRA